MPGCAKGRMEEEVDVPFLHLELMCTGPERYSGQLEKMLAKPVTFHGEAP